MPSRRQLLSALASGVTAGTAGCSTGTRPTGASDDATVSVSPSTSRSPSTASATATPRPGAGFRLVLIDRATDTTTDLVTGDDVASAGEIRDTRSGYGVPLSLTDAGTARFAEAFRAADVAAEASEHEIRLVVDGEDRSTFGVAPGLAHDIQSGEWDGELLVQVGDREAAERLRRAVTA
jgi:hypothetical protein